MNQPKITSNPNLVRNIIIMIVLIAILVLVPGRMVWHLRDQYLSQAKADNVKTQVLRTKISEARQVELHSAQFTKQLHSVQTQLPADLRLPTLINELQAICQQNGVQLTQVTPPQGGRVIVAGSGSALNPESITISVQGPPAALEQLDSALQNQPQLFSITQISLGGQTTQGNNSQNIIMNAFLWNPGLTS